MADAKKWEKHNYEKGLEFRVYDKSSKVYRYRKTIAGKAICDNLGLMAEEEALAIVATLKLNRKLKSGFQTYAEMLEDVHLTTQHSHIQEQEQKKKAVAEDAFKRASTVSLYWDTVYWLERGNQGSPKANRGLLSAFNTHWRNSIGNVPLTELDDDHINDVIKKIKSCRTERTAYHAYTTLSGMYSHAMAYFKKKKNGGVLLPPLPKCDAKATATKKTCYLSREEFEELLIELKKLPNRNLYDFAILSTYTGLRFGDIASLKWSDIRTDSITTFTTSKTDTEINVDFRLEPIMDMFKERNNFSLQAKPNTLIFVNSLGEQYKECPKMFAKIIKRLGFNEKPHRIGKDKERINFHTLRHTFASWLAQEGVSLTVIRDLLGHANITTTQIYARLSPNTIVSELQKLIKK